jgi:hypothetical protein
MLVRAAERKRQRSRRIAVGELSFLPAFRAWFQVVSFGIVMY